MLKTVSVLVSCSAVYGFSLGLVHSLKFALRNLVKFPLLLVATAVVCCLAYHVASRFLTAKLSLWDVQRLVVESFRDLALLLASLAPVFLFLAFTFAPPNEEDLGEYPWFLGMNVLCIAVCGSCALVRQARVLLHRFDLSLCRTTLIIGAWLGVSLLVGSQWAWYLRPFCGVATIDAPFILGTEPDYQGATDFFQAVHNLFDPPPLSAGYLRHASGGH
jgi:hypothetical protein